MRPHEIKTTTEGSSTAATTTTTATADEKRRLRSKTYGCPSFAIYVRSYEPCAYTASVRARHTAATWSRGDARCNVHGTASSACTYTSPVRRCDASVCQPVQRGILV